jgi:oxalate decarboxylase/phosphoglucose isomerase-like protein (cupin superfamily)
MRFSTTSGAIGVLAITIGLVAGTTADSSELKQGTTPQVAQASESTAARTPLLLAKEEGERRIRRVMGGALAIIKVDRRNGGSPGLVMGYEEIPRGQAIQAHRHPAMDEIIFVHGGTGAAELGDRTATVRPGATIYIPQATRVMLRNTGTDPLAIAYFFPQPGYEEYLRETSVLEGQPAPVLSGQELAQIRERHKAHIVFDSQ